MCPNFGFFRSKFVQISGLITKFVQISAFSVQNSSNFLFNDEICSNFDFFRSKFVFNDEFCPNFGSFSSKFIKISVLKSRNVTFRVTQPPSHSLLFVLFKIIIQIPFRKLRPKTMRSTMATRCAWLYWSRARAAHPPHPDVENVHHQFAIVPFKTKNKRKTKKKKTPSPPPPPPPSICCHCLLVPTTSLVMFLSECLRERERERKKK